MPRVQEHPDHPSGGRKYGAFQKVFLSLPPSIPPPQPPPLPPLPFQRKHHLTTPRNQEIYTNGLTKNKLPTVTTDPNKLEEQARQHLGARSYNYVAGGAGERATMDANRLAFRQWKVTLLPSRGRLCYVLGLRWWGPGC